MKKKFNLTLNILFSSILLIWIVGFLWNLIIFHFPYMIKFLPFLKYNYSIVCHTHVEKLFEFWNIKTLLCSRCSGIYLGAFISSIAILLGLKKNISTKFLLLSLLPILLDIILYTLGIYNYSQYVALSTGLLLGSLGFIYIHNSIFEMIINKER